ncbi:type II toxin-antitoxin system VapC family toxin [candidate division TA06 bacterium]|nr:type II toxin-antitoxin system VapC family toxin [candidate division TA06 bacterium]
MGVPAFHSKYVVDASIVVQWFVHHREGDFNKAQALRELHLRGQCQLVLPEFALLEVLNAIRYSRRAKEEDGAKAVELLQDLNLEVVSLTADHLRKANAISWAKEYKVHLFDAAYVAVAEVLGYPLITADKILLKKMKGHSIVLGLDELDFPQVKEEG